MPIQIRVLLTVGIAIVAGCITTARGIDLSGTIVNCCGEPVSGALVEYSAGGSSVRTDSGGNFHLGGTRVIRNGNRQHNGSSERLEVFDLKGRRLLNEDQTYVHRKRTAGGRYIPRCYIARQPGSVPRKMIAGLARHGIRLTEKGAHAVSLSKRAAVTDTLSISLQGYRQQNVPVNRDSAVVGTVYLTRSNDPASDCGTIEAHGESVITAGIGILQDSLFSSLTGYEWSTGGFAIGVPDDGVHGTLDVFPWGLYSSWSVDSYSGSYSKMVHGLVGLTGIGLLDPVFTKAGHISNVIIEEGTVIDSGCSVVLYMGYIMDPRKDYLQLNGVRLLKEYTPPTLPFDTTNFRSYFYALQAQFEHYVEDTLNLQTDTVLITRAENVGGGNPVIVLSSLRINGTITDRSIVVAGTVIIEPDAELNKCSIMSREMVINGGLTDACLFFTTGMTVISNGTHNSQFLSTDSILVEQPVNTGPASLWVVKKTVQNNACIVFKRNSALHGTAINFRDTAWVSPDNSIVLDSGSVFTGYIITDGYFSTKYVDITGGVYVHEIATKHGEGSYLGYLFGITMHKPQSPLTFPLLGEDPKMLQLFNSEAVVYCR